MRRGPYQPSATATAADDNPKAPDDYLTDDLTRSDLIYVLRNLRFRPPNSDKQADKHRHRSRCSRLSAAHAQGPLMPA
jgi:hypothetical protein